MSRGTTLRMETVTDFYIESCCNCGVLFGMTDELHDELRRNKGWFYCPNGHGQHYLGESDRHKISRLTSELDQAKAEALALNRKLSAERIERKREQRRANAGVCPHCHRQIVQMARHIRTKHPETVT